MHPENRVIAPSRKSSHDLDEIQEREGGREKTWAATANVASIKALCLSTSVTTSAKFTSISSAIRI
jgi:hypothetical protein